MGPRDADRGDACRLRFAGPGRQSSVHRRVELHRMAARAHGADGAKPRPVRACLAAAAVQHAGSGDRMGARPGVPGTQAQHRALGSLGPGLAFRQVPSRRRPDRTNPAGRGSQPRFGGVLAPQHRAHLADRGRGAGGGIRTWRPPARVALRWLADRPGVAAPLLGARNAEQLRDNLLAADLTLDERQRSELDDVSAPMTPDYPYRLLAEGTAERRRLL